MGRPSSYNQETATEICRLLEEGETLIAITDREEMPAYRTVMQWLEKHPDFAQSYARARDKQADWYADRVGELARGVLNDPKNSNAYRVAGDLLKWQAIIRSPMRYSERIQQMHQHTGSVSVKFSVSGVDDSTITAQPSSTD